MIELTDKAIRKIEALAAQQDDPLKRLRVFVKEGGCSGMEYGMRFDRPGEDDVKLGTQTAQVIVDPYSLEKIAGTVLDYDGGLHGTGFSMRNPKARETCGCGRSFN